MNYLAGQSITEKWDFSLRWVQALMKAGCIEGVIRSARDWPVPQGGQKPLDRRRARSDGASPWGDER